MSEPQTTSPQTWAGRMVPLDLGSSFDPAGVAGKTIVITGGASGLGAAFAREWARHGATIIIGDVDDAAGEALAAELRTSSSSSSTPTARHHHHYQHCDVRDWQSQVELFKAAARVSPSGGIDAVVPNAGIGAEAGGGPRFELPQGLDGDRPPPPALGVLDVNLTGVLYTVHLALFWLARNGSSPGPETGGDGEESEEARRDALPSPRARDRHILLIGSIASLMPLMESTQYTVSKHGVAGLFRCLRGTAFRRGIRVNLLCPCFVDTHMVGNGLLLVLAGGGLGELSDVVRAGTRFMADASLAGRSVVIGPRMVVEGGSDGQPQVVRAGRTPTNTTEGDTADGYQGVWECYAHDYENVEAFVYRYTRLLIAYTRLRGWLGWARDVLWILLFRNPGKR